MIISEYTMIVEMFPEGATTTWPYIRTKKDIYSTQLFHDLTLTMANGSCFWFDDDMIIR